MKEKRGNLSYIVNIIICASTPMSKVQKIPAKPIYSLVGDLHGMQEVSGSSSLGSIEYL